MLIKREGDLNRSVCLERPGSTGLEVQSLV